MIIIDGIAQSGKTSKACVYKDWQFNYNIGFTQFYGDVSSNTYFKKFSGEIAFASGFSARKYLSPVFGLGANIWYSGIKSKKNKRASGVPTNFTLSGKYFDVNVNLLIDFSKLFWGESSRKTSINGILGTGFATWNSTLSDSTSGMVIVSGDTIGSGYYKKAALVVPVGLGINYMINNNWGLNFEMKLRTIINDDVDVWRDGFKYDQLLYTSIGVSYFLNRKSKNKIKRLPRREAPVKPVSPYDFTMNNNIDNQGVSGGVAPGVILIDAPVEKKISMSSGIIYRVQIFATRTKMPSYNYLRERFNITTDIYENYQDGIYRYSTGSFNTYNEAVSYSHIMKSKGISDAFVVAYKNDIRISITPQMKN